MCEFVLVSYKQCISTMESSATVSSAELGLVRQKHIEAVMCSRRIHTLIQSKYDEARQSSKQSKNPATAISTTSQPSVRSDLALALLCLTDTCSVSRGFVLDLVIPQCGAMRFMDGKISWVGVPCFFLQMISQD